MQANEVNLQPRRAFDCNLWGLYCKHLWGLWALRKGLFFAFLQAFCLHLLEL